MKLEPGDLIERLEFDKVLQWLIKECYGEPARQYFQALQPVADHSFIEQRLREAHEMKILLAKGERFPLSAYEMPENEWVWLEVEGYILPLDSIVKIRHILLLARDIFKFFTAVRRDIYPHLFDPIRSVEWDESLLGAIQQIIDDAGNVRSDASPDLIRIRKQMISKQKELEQAFKSVINHYRNKGWLADNVESFRNGRRVLCAPSEHKRKIRGIIHDESTTGKTAFIEPEEVIGINNDIFDLEMEEKQEILHILRLLCERLRPALRMLQVYGKIVETYDRIHAKGAFAIKLKANMPSLQPRPVFGIRNGYHPLLYLKNKTYGKKTVPFDLVLRHENRILVVSGPNAGGKSILMKSVGLLQLMLQSGLLVPVSENSEMGVFQRLFADIGDQQSLEDDLSTYSSKLRNMKHFLEHADAQSLVLIDEFGSGTDPNIGGAIAEGILKELNYLGVFGVMTTHFSNLKIFAFKHTGIVNGSMHFDREHLSPTFELQVGRPGSSYAFEIATKIGLSKKVLHHARHRIGSNEKAVDELLIDLQNEKKEVEAQLKSLSEKEKLIDRLIKNYDSAHRELEVRRQKLKLEAKELLLRQSAKETSALENLVRELKNNKKIEDAQQLVREARLKRAHIGEEMTQIEQEMTQQQARTADRILAAGDYVRIRNGGATGQIEKIDEKEAIVLVGDMRMTIRRKDLQWVQEPLEIQKIKVHTQMVESGAQFSPQLDIRGLSGEEAMKVLETFFDQAVMGNVPQLRILHGKGTGVLRNLVRTKAKEYKEITKISHPAPREGGDGISIVDIKI